ncbi:MAG: thioredoxin fold domain-containing protein [Thiomonas sp.]
MKASICAVLLSIALASGLSVAQPAPLARQDGGAAAAVSKPDPDVTAATKVLAELQAATYIREGRGMRVLTIFFDPNCPYCRELYSDLRPFVGKEGLQLQWAPVAILAPSSLGKAAAILQARDRLQAFRAMENHGLDPNLPAPATLTASQIHAKTRQVLKTNTTVLKRAGVYFSVPLAVYRNREGQPQLLLGIPGDDKALAALLQSVGP